MFCVYMATNLVNGKRYVGVTRGRLKDRIWKHKSLAKNGKGYRLHTAMRKYGFESFEFSIIESCLSAKELLEAEIRLISQMKPEYNVTSGGDGTAGLIMSEKTREKLKASLRGRVGSFLGRTHTDKTKALLREISTGKPGFWKGKKRPGIGIKGNETKKDRGSFSRYWLGKSRSEDTKRKISETKKGNIPPDHSEAMIIAWHANIRKAIDRLMKPIICINDGMKFDSVRAASEYYGIAKSTISGVALGKRKSAFGKVFKYEEAMI